MWPEALLSQLVYPKHLLGEHSHYFATCSVWVDPLELTMDGGSVGFKVRVATVDLASLQDRAFKTVKKAMDIVRNLVNERVLKAMRPPRRKAIVLDATLGSTTTYTAAPSGSVRGGGLVPLSSEPWKPKWRQSTLSPEAFDRIRMDLDYEVDRMSYRHGTYDMSIRFGQLLLKSISGRAVESTDRNKTVNTAIFRASMMPGGFECGVNDW